MLSQLGLMWNRRKKSLWMEEGWVKETGKGLLSMLIPIAFTYITEMYSYKYNALQKQQPKVKNTPTNDY